MPEQGTHAPSPAPDLIPAETKNQLGDSHRDWYSKRGHFTTRHAPFSISGDSDEDDQDSDLIAISISG